MKKLLFIILLLPLFTTASNKYVSGRGGSSDSNNGNAIGTAYRTIDKINSISLSGIDTVYWECGYQYLGVLVKSNANTVYAAYGTGAKPILTYQGGSSPPNTTTFEISGNGVKFIGLNFCNPSQSSNRALVATNSIGVEITGDNCVFTNCEFNKIGCGVFANTSQTPSFYNCYFHDMRMIVADGASDNDYGANGIIANVVINLTCLNCIMDSCFAPSPDYIVDGGAIESFGSCSGWTVMRNYFNLCNSITEMGSGSGGTCQKYNIVYNKIINCGEIAYANAGGSFPMQADSIRWWNNAIADTAGGFGFGAVFNYAGTMTSSNVYDLRNNIFMLQGGIDVATSGDATKMHRDHNGYNTTDGSTVGFSLGTGDYTISNIYTTFVNPSAGNFNLIPGCSSEGAGQLISGISQADFAGNPIGSPPNAGAYGPQVPVGSRKVLWSIPL